jgi:hypothetical protein
LTYAVPTGWQELPAGGIRVAAFAIKEGDEQADVTVIPLAREAGSLLANVNRWRGEVGLEPATESQLKAAERAITVDGSPRDYVDLAGPRLRTLAVMLTRGEHTWFIKMKGTAALVARQKTAFEDFVKSVKFPSGAGD